MAFDRIKHLNIIRLWYEKEKPKPLLLWGARQVGKTHLMRRAAEMHFPNNLYLNFEKEKGLAELFRESLAPEKIIYNLSLHLERKIDPALTVLIFD